MEQEVKTCLKALHRTPRASTTVDRLGDLDIECVPVGQGLDTEEFDEGVQLSHIILPITK
jgi:hypothetical protein